MSNLHRVVAGSAVALMAAAAHADFNSHFGINVEDGRLTTWDWVSGPGYIAPDRVFVSTLDGTTPSDSPGTNSVGGTFDTPGDIGFNFLHELRIWDNPQDGFRPTDGETLTMRFGPLSATTGTGFVPGWATAVRDENSHPDNPNQWGRHHIHPEYELNAASGQPDPADGVYLVELEWFYEAGSGNPTSYDNSDPFWIVFGYNATLSEIEAAETYVREVIVPAPGAAGLLALGGLVALRRRR